MRQDSAVAHSALPGSFPSEQLPQFEINRRLPTADQIYHHLRNAILFWQVLPKEPISENRVSGMFGVSRSPVRTAIARLAEEGLIDVFPQRGTFVAPIRLQAVREAQFARLALEVALVCEAADKWTPAHAQALGESLTRQVRHAEARDVTGFYAENETFHLIIARAAGLEGVWKMIQSVKALWDRVGHIANRNPEHLQSVIAEHEGVVLALQKNDREAARAAMTVHMSSLASAIERLRPEHPDYFED